MRDFMWVPEKWREAVGGVGLQNTIGIAPCALPSEGGGIAHAEFVTQHLRGHVLASKRASDRASNMHRPVPIRSQMHLIAPERLAGGGGDHAECSNLRGPFSPMPGLGRGLLPLM